MIFECQSCLLEDATAENLQKTYSISVALLDSATCNTVICSVLPLYNYVTDFFASVVDCMLS